MIRTAIAFTISPVLAVTGFRFSKDYRHGASLYHRIVYATVQTVTANYFANLLSGRKAPFLEAVL